MRTHRLRPKRPRAARCIRHDDCILAYSTAYLDAGEWDSNTILCHSERLRRQFVVEDSTILEDFDRLRTGVRNRGSELEIANSVERGRGGGDLDNKVTGALVGRREHRGSKSHKDDCDTEEHLDTRKREKLR